MASFSLVRTRRTAENESPLPAVFINNIADSIPDFGDILPFVYKMRFISFQCGQGILLCDTEVYEIVLRVYQGVFAVGDGARAPGFSATFRSFDAYRPGRFEGFDNPVFHQPSAISIRSEGHSLINGWDRYIDSHDFMGLNPMISWD
ncbi:hypothetical protein TALC_00489 [Thermoplasmatales archaeon BRNA1]|nr:hypothetical protein TALC_00489 [Thermoplasmatales archaeon BRNA1]